jgi:hypothetical protein
MSRKNGNRDLQALRNLIFEARSIVSTAKLPEGRTESAVELLDAALSSADHLLTLSPAAALGQRGGRKTAKRGAAYFRKISNMRKTHAGGRPKGAKRG